METLFDAKVNIIQTLDDYDKFLDETKEPIIVFLEYPQLNSICNALVQDINHEIDCRGGISSNVAISFVKDGIVWGFTLNELDFTLEIKLSKFPCAVDLKDRTIIDDYTAILREVRGILDWV